VSFIALVHEKEISLNTNEIVFSSEKVGALVDVLETSEHLKDTLKYHEKRVKYAEEAGFSSGFEKGQEEGRAAARQELAEEMTALAFKSKQQQHNMKQSVIKLVMQVVRKVAVTFGPDKVIAAIARKAVDDLLANDFLIIYVNPSVKDAVDARLTESINDENSLQADHFLHKKIINGKKSPHIDIRTDEGLSVFECQIHTEFGITIASLDHQLKCLETLIENAFATNKKGLIAKSSPVVSRLNTPSTEVVKG